MRDINYSGIFLDGKRDIIEFGKCTLNLDSEGTRVTFLFVYHSQSS